MTFGVGRWALGVGRWVGVRVATITIEHMNRIEYGEKEGKEETG